MVESRTEAQRFIELGRIRVSGVPVPKASTLVDPETPLTVEAERRYVSRGGEKLEGALSAFGVRVRGRRALDVGASTGGFTDCLLRAGAAEVTAVDVGYGQLDWTLRSDERVVVRERVNIRFATCDDLGGPFDLVVADLSFISLCTVGPALAGLASEEADLILLVKPQFEVGKGEVGKGGVVRDPEKHREAVAKVIDCLASEGLGTRAVTRSPVAGARGNVEFFVWVRKEPVSVADREVDRAVAEDSR